MTNVGQEILRLRTAKKLNQSEAAKQCRLNQSIFSRIENGKIERPSKEVLARLAEGLGANTETLASLVPGSSETFRVGFAHSIWAAPVIPSIMGGISMAEVKFTSYGEFQPAESYQYAPYWYEAKKSGPILTGPSFGNFETPLHPGVSRHPKQSRFSAYSALDLDRLLSARRLDCIVAAKHVFSESDPRILRCARLMDCVGGGMAVLVWRKDSKFHTVLKKIEESEVKFLPEITKMLELKRLPLLTYFGLGSSSEKTLEFFGKDAHRVVERCPVVLRDWPQVLKQLQATLNDTGGFIFLGWEPFISSVSKTFAREEKRTRIHLSDQKPMPYLSFDIMFSREDAARWIDKGVVKKFLREVRKNIDTLKVAIASQHKDSGIIRQISGYLDVEENNCLSILSRIDFGFLYYPEWLEFQGLSQ